jgi:hypothetical protein
MSSSDLANFLASNGLRIFKLNPAAGNVPVCYCRIADDDQGRALLRQLNQVEAEGHIGNFRGAHAVIVTGGIAKLEELGLGVITILPPETFIARLRAEHAENNPAWNQGAGK